MAARPSRVDRATSLIAASKQSWNFSSRLGPGLFVIVTHTNQNRANGAHLVHRSLVPRGPVTERIRFRPCCRGQRLEPLWSTLFQWCRRHDHRPSYGCYMVESDTPKVHSLGKSRTRD